MRLILSALIAGSVAAGVPAPAADNSFAIRDARVFDGEHVIDHANVIVRGGLVTAVGRHVPIPPGLSVVEAAGETLLPGLIDAHVHVFPGAQSDALRFGVTTELDMFNLSHEFSQWRAQREGLKQVREADTWSAGTGVSAPGGHPDRELPPGVKMPTLSRPEDARAFVSARVAEGSDYVKLIMDDMSLFTPDHLIPTLSREEVCAAVRAAHELGKMTIVHVSRLRDARVAVECGADGLAHLFPDEEADAGFVALARAHHIFVETTLAVAAGVLGAPVEQDLYERPDVKPLLSAAQRRTLAFALHAAVPHGIDPALKSVRILHRAGVPLLAATDASAPGVPHGIALHAEMRVLASAGLSPVEVLAAATSVPARIFHLPGRGCIAVACRADLLLVHGDPTKHIADTVAIDRIWKNGFVVPRESPAD